MKCTLRSTDMVDLRSVVAAHKWAAYDCETWAITPGVVAPPLVVASVCGPENIAALLEKPAALEWLHKLLAADRWIVGQNIVFDLAVACRADPTLLLPVFRAFENNRVIDTMVVEKMRKISHGWTRFDPRLGKRPRYGLEDLVNEYLGEMMVGKHGKDAWRLRYKELDGIDLKQWPAEAKSYAMDDASYTARLFLRQVETLGSDAAMSSTLIDLSRQMRAAWGLHIMGMWGLRTDSAAVETLDHRLRGHVESELAYLHSVGIFRQEWRKDKDRITKKSVGEKKLRYVRTMKVLEGLVEACFNARGEPCPLTEGGKGEVKKPKPKTDSETLLATLDEDLTRLADISGDAKLLNTYVPILRDGTRWPICASYNVIVDTGRSSCRAPNIQNQPRKGGVRECFIPRPGYVYVGCDYQAAELRSLAQVCLTKYGYSEMAKAFEHSERYPVGKDLHGDMAASILALDYDEYIEKLHKKESGMKDTRQLSKCANFGFPGGLGAKKFVSFAWGTYRVKLTESEAKILKAQWLRKYPEVQRMFDDIGTQTSGGRQFTLKHIFSGRLRGGVRFNDGCNCVDYETEALTDRGWLHGLDIQDTDRILTKDASTGELVWQHPTALNHYPDYVGPVHHFKTHSFDAVTTSQHRWLVDDKRTKAPRVVFSSQLSLNGDHRIHRTGQMQQPDNPLYSDDFLQLTGWFLTDGSLMRQGSSIRLFQSKPSMVSQIDALFERLGVTVRRRVAAYGVVVWTLSDAPLYRTGFGGKDQLVSGPQRRQLSWDDYVAAGIGVRSDAEVAYDLQVTVSAVGARRRVKGLPRPAPRGTDLPRRLKSLFPDRLLSTAFVVSLSARQANILLETMILGDGTRVGTSTTFFTRSEIAAAAFQALCTVAGFASSSDVRDMSACASKQKTYASMPNKPQLGHIWCVRVLLRETAQVQRAQVCVVNEARGMWCPTVPNGFFVARRAGRVYVTGNSGFQGLTADGAKMACWAVVKESWTGYAWDEPIPADAVGPGRSELGPFPPGAARPDSSLGFRPSAFIHDEIMGESPMDRFRAHAARLQIVMCEAMKWFLPDIPVEAEAHAMRRWFKDAEPAFDKDGVLQLWEPPHPSKVAKSLLNETNKEVLQPILDKTAWTDEDIQVVANCDPEVDRFKKTDWFAVNMVWKLNELSKTRELAR